MASFFPIVVEIIRSVKVQSQPPKAFLFAPSPWEVNARGSSDQIIQIAVISEYMSTFGWDLFSDLRD